MRQEAQNWWKQAKEDYSAAKYNFKGRKFYLAAFMSQQSIEKALKALLIQLTRLAKLLNAPIRIIELCAKITPAYIASRYPDSAKKYSKQECEKILKYTQEVLVWTKKNL